MKGIRGAVTIEEDSPLNIKQAVSELLKRIEQENKLLKEQFICILFSSTADLKSYYPAKAAREAGYSFCALYSSLEPEIDGALEKCIRVLVLADTEQAPKHVYLGKAAELRKDITRILNIAIDGPAGSGKSTIAKILARDYGILYLDTGAMYRACALKCLRDKIDADNEKQVSEAVGDIHLKIEYSNGKQITLLDGNDVSEEIRIPEISNIASKISTYRSVRNKMVEMQREIAKSTSCVLDGRDIGTNVLPDAEYKFYLTATAEVRAQRRFKENQAKGYSESLPEILKSINERDERDKNREIAPLKRADDAVEIDTSLLSIEEVASVIKAKIQEKI